MVPFFAAGLRAETLFCCRTVLRNSAGPSTYAAQAVTTQSSRMAMGNGKRHLAAVWAATCLHGADRLLHQKMGSKSQREIMSDQHNRLYVFSLDP